MQLKLSLTFGLPLSTKILEYKEDKALQLETELIYNYFIYYHVASDEKYQVAGICDRI